MSRGKGKKRNVSLSSKEAKAELRKMDRRRAREEENPEKKLSRRLLVELLIRNSTLTLDEEQVVRILYGFVGGKHSHAEIAEEMKISEFEVRAIERSALEKLASQISKYNYEAVLWGVSPITP